MEAMQIEETWFKHDFPLELPYAWNFPDIAGNRPSEKVSGQKSLKQPGKSGHMAAHIGSAVLGDFS